MTRASVLAITLVSLAAFGGCDKKSTKSPDAGGVEDDGAPDGDSAPDEEEEPSSATEEEEDAPGLDKPGGW